MASLDAYLNKNKKSQSKSKEVKKEDRLLSIYQQYQDDPSKLDALDSLYWELNAPKNFKDAIRLAPKTKNQISPKDSARALIEKSLDKGISPEESLYVSKFASTDALRKQYDTKAISKKKQKDKQTVQEKRRTEIKKLETEIEKIVKDIDKNTDDLGEPFPNRVTLVKTQKKRMQRLQENLQKVDPTNPLIEVKIDQTPIDTTDTFDKVKDTSVSFMKKIQQKLKDVDAFTKNRDLLYNLEFKRTGSEQKASAFQKKWQELLESGTIVEDKNGVRAIYIGGDPSNITSWKVVK